MALINTRRNIIIPKELRSYLVINAALFSITEEI
jgi:hypothetical protein